MEEIMEELQQLRYKASELLLREEWEPSIHLYNQLISLCYTHLQNTNQIFDPDQIHKLKRSLCLALSNRAEARSRLKDFSQALEDCDLALEIESAHFKTLVCKGKILLDLDHYSKASDCFKQALALQKCNGASEPLNGFFVLAKKLEFQSRTGNFDLSDWVLNGFGGRCPEIAEYVGPVQIAQSENGGRGLFATRNIDAGTLLLVNKAVAIGRAILPEPRDDCNETAQLVMWKDFVDKILNVSAKCKKILNLIYTLSTGEDEQSLQIPDINLFRPESAICFTSDEKPDMGRILKALDVNSLTEDSISAKVLGKNNDYYGVGLWILPSFINHSCNPNARRLHVGDHILVHASRDVKAGEEISFAYFDVLLPLKKRREISKVQWGFDCDCKRCRFEESLCCQEELGEIEKAFESGLDVGGVVVKLEEGMRKWMLKGKEKGFLRASFWPAYWGVFKSERVMRRLGRKVPAAESVVESVVEAVGGDERMVKAVAERPRKSCWRGAEMVEMERAMKLGRSVYGKVVKKQAMRSLLELGAKEHSY